VVVQTSQPLEKEHEFALGIVNYEQNKHFGKEVGLLDRQKDYLCFLLGRPNGATSSAFYKVNTSNVLTMRSLSPEYWDSYKPLVTVWL
jgi:hypothetical protein